MNVKTPYDDYYKTENLFGEAYPELIDFYKGFNTNSHILDLGCGQGRDSIALAKLGFKVTGIDHSKVGIDQLNAIAKKEKIDLLGIVANIYEYSYFDQFDFILMDSMFHFGKKEKAKEIELLTRIIEQSKFNAIITICIQKSKNKIAILHDLIDSFEFLKTIHCIELIYKFEDLANNHSSKTKYEMISFQKQL